MDNISHLRRLRDAIGDSEIIIGDERTSCTRFWLLKKWLILPIFWGLVLIGLYRLNSSSLGAIQNVYINIFITGMLLLARAFGLKIRHFRPPSLSFLLSKKIIRLVVFLVRIDWTEHVAFHCIPN